MLLAPIEIKIKQNQLAHSQHIHKHKTDLTESNQKKKLNKINISKKLYNTKQLTYSAARTLIWTFIQTFHRHSSSYLEFSNHRQEELVLTVFPSSLTFSFIFNLKIRRFIISKYSYFYKIHKTLNCRGQSNYNFLRESSVKIWEEGA